MNHLNMPAGCKCKQLHQSRNLGTKTIKFGILAKAINQPDIGKQQTKLSSAVPQANPSTKETTLTTKRILIRTARTQR